MASKEQTRANRKNAQRSTGPRTAGGKAKSSQNALKHGLRAQATVLPDENIEEFELLVGELEDQFQPQSAIEWTLLRQLADAEWRMRRVPCFEAGLFAAKLNETVRYYQEHPGRLPEEDAEARMILIGRATERDANNGDTFSKLSRYESRLSHRYFKALEQLQKLQSARLPGAQTESQRPQPAPAGGDAPIAAGDPSPVRKGRVTEGPSPSASNPRSTDKCRNDASTYEAIPSKGDSARPPRRAKRTQFYRCRRAQSPNPTPAYGSEGAVNATWRMTTPASLSRPCATSASGYSTLKTTSLIPALMIILVQIRHGENVE